MAVLRHELLSVLVLRHELLSVLFLLYMLSCGDVIEVEAQGDGWDGVIEILPAIYTNLLDLVSCCIPLLSLCLYFRTDS